MIKFEQEVCDYLCIPSIPRKEWNKKDSFKKGVAVVRLSVSGVAYAVCTFDNEADTEPRIVKTFASEPFYKTKKAKRGRLVWRKRQRNLQQAQEKTSNTTKWHNCQSGYFPK